MNTTKYRVFVSYSHKDQTKFDLLLKTLTNDFNLEVLSDRNIGAGTPFTDSIKGLISHAHLFIPLITKTANLKPWVHQETGFAMARNIPILPIVVEDTGMPTEMIAQLQAIKVRTDLSDLVGRLDKKTIERLILLKPSSPYEMVQIAEWPEQRTQWLSEFANRVRNLDYKGFFRQRGALSSFCIPDADISDKIWQRREGKHRRSDYYLILLREERRALEWHAREAGCRLIVDPSMQFKNNSLDQTLARLETLLAFLESAKDFRVEIVFSPQAREGSLTLVGDWFVADSLVPRPGGYLQTIFNWHAPTVSRWVQRFDELFHDLCQKQKLDPVNSRKVAIEQISLRINEYKNKMSADNTESTQPT